MGIFFTWPVNKAGFNCAIIQSCSHARLVWLIGHFSACMYPSSTIYRNVSMSLYMSKYISVCRDVFCHSTHVTIHVSEKICRLQYERQVSL